MTLVPYEAPAAPTAATIGYSGGQAGSEAWNSGPNEWAICSAVARSGLTAVRYCRDAGLTADLFGQYPLSVAFRALCRLAEETGTVSAPLDKPLMRSAIAIAWEQFGIETPSVTDFVATAWDRGFRTTSAATGALQKHCDRVRDTGQMRAMHQELLERLNACADWDGQPLEDGSSSAQAFIAETQTRLMQVYRLGSESGASAAVDVAEYADSYYDALSTRYQDPARRLLGLDSGYPRLNDILSGLRQKRLHILTGKSGAGKSALAKDLVARTCFRNRIGPTNRPVYAHLFSLEMDRDELMERMLFGGPTGIGVSTKAYRDRMMSPLDWQRLAAARDALKETQIKIYDSGNLTLARIWTELRMAQAAGRCDLAVVDYLQLIPPESAGKTQNREQEVAAISRGLKAISRTVNIPVIALSQLNEAGQVRESRAIHHDADVWMDLQEAERPDGSSSSGNAGGESSYATTVTSDVRAYSLYVKKQRGGPEGRVDLEFRPDNVRFDQESNFADELGY